MSRPPQDTALAIAYRAASGRRREAVIGVDRAGRWFVYDIPVRGLGRTGRVVEQLCGQDERLRQAIAVLSDYAACQQAYAAGERDAHLCPDPLPSPQRIALSQIRECTGRALRVAFTQANSAEDHDLLEQLHALTGSAAGAAAPAA